MGQEENLLRCESETDKVIEEEIVEFIRSDEIFGHLFDLAVCSSREEFRTDRGVYDIHEDLLD